MPTDKDADMRQLKELITLMERHGLMEIELVEEGRKIRLQKAPPPVHAQAVHALPAAGPAPADARGAPAAPLVAEGLVEIHSPMVGTFYRAASPDTDPFVEEGTHVEKGDVLGIVEAMKVMNELKSEHTGIIEKIVVENIKAIEYGETLFLIRVD